MMVIAFEIHLTIENIGINKRDVFENCCREVGGKPLLIELSRGDVIHQPMLSIVVHQRDPEMIWRDVQRYQDHLERHGFTILRVKVEVPVEHDNILLMRGGLVYYEWHGKIDYHHATALALRCEEHGAHLSRNALQAAQSYRFVTLRAYSDRDTFLLRVQRLQATLNAGGWPIVKQQYEFCVFDSRTELDINWLSIQTTSQS